MRVALYWSRGEPLTGGEHVEDVEDLSFKLSLGKQEEWREGVSRSGFISHYASLI